jgi:hypothetical protein
MNLRIESNVSLLASTGGPWKEVGRTHNVITTLGRVLTARMLADEANRDTGLTHHALGTGTDTPAASDTTLGSEQARNPVTSVLRSTSRLQFRTFFPASEANFHIREIGLFGHDATTTSDSGELFSRALLNFDNSSTSNPRDLTLVHEIGVT